MSNIAGGRRRPVLGLCDSIAQVRAPSDRVVYICRFQPYGNTRDILPHLPPLVVLKVLNHRIHYHDPSD